MTTSLVELKGIFLKLKHEISILLDQEDKTKYSYLQNYLYINHYPLFSYAESVIILCENRKYNSASVLLRVLIETHINIVYHQLNDSERRLALSAKVSFDQKIRILNELQELIKRHSNLESKDPTDLFSHAYIEKSLEWSKVHRQAIIKANNLNEGDRDLDLKSKALRCDQEFNGNADKGHFERMYTVIYRYLSPFTHLDIEGLQMFVDGDTVSQRSFHDGANGDHLAAEAIDVCVAFSKDLYDQGLIKGERIEIINTVENLLRF